MIISETQLIVYNNTLQKVLPLIDSHDIPCEIFNIFHTVHPLMPREDVIAAVNQHIRERDGP